MSDKIEEAVNLHEVASTSRNLPPERGVEQEIRREELQLPRTQGEENLAAAVLLRTAQETREEPQLPGRTQGEENLAEGNAVILALREIESDPALRLRLRLWQNEDELLRTRIEQKEQSVTKTKNEIYQLFGIFAVFEGVILTALAQASKLHCLLWWIPFVLTAFAGLAVTFAVWYKFRRCEEFQFQVDIEKENAKAISRTINKFLASGMHYDPDDLQQQPIARPVKKKREIKWMISVTTPIVAFTAVILVACILILCK